MRIGLALAALLWTVSNAAGQGLQFSSPKEVQGLDTVPRYRAYLPARVDLSRWFPTPGNQGKLGSCTGWAVSYARSYYVARYGGGGRNRPSNRPSQAYIYGAATRPSNCTRGSSFVYALRVLKRVGAPSAAQFPYSPYRCPAPRAVRMAPQPSFRRFAIQQFYIIGRRSNRYKPRLDDVKGVLARGIPVMFGMRTTSSFHRLRGNRVWRGGGALRPGGHAMTLVGYDERRQAFKLINSWGTRWGQNGFGWIGYGAFQRLARNAFFMRVGRTRVRPKVVRPKRKRVRPVVVRPKPKPRPVLKIQPALKTYKCAGLRVVWRNQKALIRGFVSSAADFRKLTAAAKKAKAKVALHIRPWPQCEALLTFRRVFAAPGAPKIEIVGNRKRLKKGDQLVIKVTSPAKPSYLYLVFIQASGGVVYLVQPATAVSAPMPPKRQLTFGDGAKGGSKFIASASPLFDKARPATEIERDFLTAFRRACL
jgi:hypothetical protein